MRIGYLADYPEFLQPLAELHFAEWSYLRPSENLEHRASRLSRCCGRRSIPTAIVAVEDADLCGSALLVAHDMDDRAELTPWIAGVYVVPGMRGRGIGTALINRIVEEARSLDVQALYLYTPSAIELYTRLGWEPVERRKYLGAQVTVMARQFAV